MIRPLVTIWQDPTLRLCCGVLMLCGAMIASIMPYLSLIGVQIFGFSDQMFSAIFAVSGIVGVAASIFVGIYTDQRSNRRLVAVICGVLLILGAMAVTFWPGRGTFLVTHVLIWPVAFTLFSQIFALARLAASAHPEDVRDSILSAVRAMFALAFIIVLPVWSYAFAQGIGLMAIYAFCTVVALICAFVILLAWPVDGQTNWEDPKSGLTFSQSLKEIAHPKVLGRVVLTGAITAGVSMQTITAGLLFDQAASRDASDTALFAGLIAGLEVPFMLGMAFFLARYRKSNIIIAGAILYAVFLSVFAVSVDQTWVWFLTLPAAAGAAIILSVQIAYLQDLMKDRPGAGGSLLALNNVLGQIIAASVFAIGTMFAGYATAAVLGSIIMALAAVAMFLLERRKA